MNVITKLRLLASASGLLLMVASAVGGQSAATLSGPVLGYVFSAPEGKLRPLRGVLGSATIGDPLPFDFAITQAWTLDKSHVVVSTSDSPELLAISLETNPVSLTAISGAPSDPSQAAASIHGKAGAFYYAASQRLGIVTGLPGSPSVSQSIDLSFLRGQPLTHVAVSDDGTLLLYSIIEADRESLYVWTPSASSRLVLSVVSVGGIAIAENGAAIVTDSGANEVFAIPDARNSTVSQFLLGERDGVSRPAGVAISTNNQIYIANTGLASLVILDSSGRLLRTQDCDCDVSSLNMLRDSVFRLTDRLDRAVYLLEASPSGDRILFIPALRRSQ
jgi:DNA-binding beta-propeller fold protein YncE